MWPPSCTARPPCCRSPGRSTPNWFVPLLPFPLVAHWCCVPPTLDSVLRDCCKRLPASPSLWFCRLDLFPYGSAPECLAMVTLFLDGPFDGFKKVFWLVFWCVREGYEGVCIMVAICVALHIPFRGCWRLLQTYEGSTVSY